MLPARVRTAAGWSDACILNVSSRGLMVRAPLVALESGFVELWHGDHAISARIVWRDGLKAGLQAEGPIPVEQILSLATSASLQLTAEPYRGVERRKRPRTDSRVQARVFEFASIAIVAAALAGGFCFWVGEALAQPLLLIRTALR
jgi:hypothetical protein